MDEQQELAKARSLLWELHKLGGPCPQQMDAQEIVRRYRELLAAEASGAGPRAGPLPDPA